jgi:oxygen-independent coproporphyrinogen III oxidase
MPNAVYIHIPFCEQICHYCDFNKFLIERQPVDEYLNSLKLEMEHTIQKYPYEQISSIYIGGGTPTSLSSEQLEKLLKIINDVFGPDIPRCEYTVEANPSVTDRKKLEVLKKYGVNRLSIGVQAFQDVLLESLNRNHREEDIKAMIKAAREIGFRNISIDLMFSLPGQSLSMFQESIRKAVSFEVEHISAYSLQIEPKTVFYIRHQKGLLTAAPQELEAEMFELLMKEMTQSGYLQYEISNFTKSDYESKHNLTYWNNEEYYGFGAGAHSYVYGNRNANAGPLKKYIGLIKENGFPYMSVHEVPKHEIMEEEMFLGLRKIRGVSKRLFQEKFGIELTTVFENQITQLLKRHLIVDDGEFIKLTHEGILLGNEVFQEFIGI